GIRDKLVTGVQTCALPILTVVPESENAHVLPVTPSFGAVVNVPMVPERPLALPRMNSYVPPFQKPVGHCVLGLSSTQPAVDPERSEERRVGKEWGSGGSGG